jgi:competence protein ComEC
MWLLYVSCAWVGGVFLGSRVGLPLPILSLGLVPFLLLPFFPSRRKHLVVAGLFLLALIGGALRFPSDPAQTDPHLLRYYNDTGMVEIRGMVSEEPETGGSSCQLTLAAYDIAIEDTRREISGSTLIRVPAYPCYHYGDVLRVHGELQTPERFDGFDYQGYLAHQGIHSIVYYPEIEVLDTGRGSRPLRWLYSLRESLSDSLARALSEPQGSLAQGILLGTRSNIPYALTQVFSRTGTAHLLAISGLHIAIVIGMVLSLAIFAFGRQHHIYIWLALLAVWLYALLTGMRPPVIRGAIMGSLFLIAELLGRQRSAVTALSFAAAVMVAIDPQVLWSASFQLSFLAMAGIIFLYPHFHEWARKGVAALSGDRETVVAAAGTVTDALALSLAAIIAVWPVIAYHFGTVSVVALPATLFSLPALPVIIMTSALVAFAGLFAPLVAQALGWIAWLFLSYLLLVVRGFDASPLASVHLDTASVWPVWVYYVVLAAAVTLLTRRRQPATSLPGLAFSTKAMAWLRPRKKWLIPPLLIVSILVWSAVPTMPDDRLHVTFLDVGQGDAIFIQTETHHNILIDGGPDPRRISLALGEKLPFWDRTIHLMVSTQPHADHIAGLVEVLHRYEVKQVLEPGVPYDSAPYREWLAIVEQNEIEHSIARAGREIVLGEESKLQILNPPLSLFQESSSDVDNNGIVLRLNCGEVSFLLTADIRQEAEFELVRQRLQLTSTVLKVAHHGSKTSTCPQFLSVTDPEIAVISAGADNPFGHPSPEVVQRLETRLGADRVYLTSERGTIEFITDGEKLWVQTEK